MSIRFATEPEIADWNERILANPDGGNFLQSKEISELKRQSGWTPRYLLVDDLAILALEKSVPILGKLWYVIKGPGITSTKDLGDILPDIKRFADENGVFMVKIEPEIVKTDETLVELMKLGLLKVRNVQPNASTILLDISGELDGILASLNQKGRHAIRRAERDGAVIKQVPATEEHCREMYRLYKLTAEGQFSARPYQYYKHFWQTFERSGMGQLFFAYANDQLVAGAYAIVLGEKSVYKDGASLRERPVYGISHLLQWHVIQWSQSKGAKVHDFLGSPPSDQINNPKHPYYGFGRFKVSFSKNVVDFVGAYDCIVRPYRYTLWTKLGERIVLRWHFWRHHESFY